MLSFVKSELGKVVAGAYYVSGCVYRQLRGKLVILMYHRVLAGNELNQSFVQPGMYVRTDVFEKQMTFLKKHFEILSFAEFLNLKKERKWDDNKRYCIITFDDGWCDNCVNAYPVLKKLKIPATIFLPTALIDTRQWFWADKLGYLLRHYYVHGISAELGKSLSEIISRYPFIDGSKGRSIDDRMDTIINEFKKSDIEEVGVFIEQLSGILGLKVPDSRMFLNWEEIEEMSNHGISFGSHSCTHRILTTLTIQEVRKEIEESLKILSDKKINLVPVFCYPNGNVSPEIASLVRLAGYQAAVSTRSGFEDEDLGDMFALRRIGIHDDISNTVPLFSFHISGVTQGIPKLKKINSTPAVTSPLKGKTILHMFSGDLWAGAEVMVFNLLNKLRDDPDLRIIALSLNEGILAGKLREIGIETYVIPESSNSFIKIFVKSAMLIRKRKIDIIHSHRYKENLLGLILSKVFGVKRLVTTMHGLVTPHTRTGKGKGKHKDKSEGKNILLSLTTKINYYILKNYFTDVVAVSQDVKNVLVQKCGFDPVKVAVIHNGIPMPMTSRALEPSNPAITPENGVFHIGTVGRMVPVKDFGFFLEIAAELKKRADNIRFSILGDGPLKGHLIQKARDLKIEDCVEILPPRPDPLSYYQSLDIYLNTSLHEGIPLSILEAMACGKPVVAPQVGGIPEIVFHGENGFLLESRDRKVFADSCNLLLNNEGLRSTIGEKNKEKINLNLSDLEMSKNYKAIYRKNCSLLKVCSTH